MARAMTELELLEFYELNRQLSELHAAKGEHSTSQELIYLMGEIEKHLYQFEGDRGGDNPVAGAQP